MAAVKILSQFTVQEAAVGCKRECYECNAQNVPRVARSVGQAFVWRPCDQSLNS